MEWNHDKTRVLDIKPLRSLRPVFPNGNQAPPFVCAPPFGPFPPGFTPFYPFTASQAIQQALESQNQPQNPPQHQPQNPSHNVSNPSVVTPLNSFGSQNVANHSVVTTPLNSFGSHNVTNHSVVTTPVNSFGSQNVANHLVVTSPVNSFGAQNVSIASVVTPPVNSFGAQNVLNASVVTPLNSFGAQNVSNPSVVTPLMSFGSAGTSNGDMEPEGSTVRRRIPKKRRPKNVNFESGISVAGKENGYRELVLDILMRFDAVRRRFAQLEDPKESSGGIIDRPDLPAGSNCMSNGVRTNTIKRLGIVPGVEIGDIFFFRFEMCLAGLHSPSMAGIDYLVINGASKEEEPIPIAVSIVSSGLFDNNDEGNPDVLIYTGQDGNTKKGKQSSDQKLKKGNIALENSMKRNHMVRVIRGLKENSHKVKIYVYDGLYEIKESWVEKGKSGDDTFKYKLVRAPGQPPAFATWIAVKKWKAGLPSRQGLIVPDITAGVESIPVSLVNEVDAESEPAYFNYSTTVKYSESFKLMQPSLGCDCGNTCKPGNLNCQCIKKNGGDFPYTGNGVLVSRKPMIYECSPSCPCLNCKSKVTQMGLKVRLEVFKTANRGWGLRSWDPIRAGSFICIYAGEAKDKSKVQQTMANDDYTFDTTRVSTPFKWNYEPGLADEDVSVVMSEEPEIPLPLIISARNIGNVARFMNHSCSPNVFWQPVTYESNSQLVLHVAFFAISHIPPMTELTYNYGVSRPIGTQNGNPFYGKKKCLCGSEYCRGSFG